MTSGPKGHEHSARRVLHFWAVANAVLSVGLATAAVGLIPWKTPLANVGLILYALSLAAASIGLGRRRPWGWKLSVRLACAGIVSGGLVATLLVMSWAFLRTVWGEFGTGASIAALLLAGLVVQFLVLYPVLLLRALTRPEVQAELGVQPTRAWRSVLYALAILALVAGPITGLLFHRRSLDRLSPDQQALAVRYLQARLGGLEPPALDALAGIPAGAAPLTVVAWMDGEPVFRERASGETMAAALVDAGKELERAVAERPDLTGSVLHVQRVLGRGRIPFESPFVVAVSLDAGVDGLERGDRVLMPDVMIRRGHAAAGTLIPGVTELRSGLDAPRLLADLADGSGPLFRLKLEEWVEYNGAALPIDRGTTPSPYRGPQQWRRAARSGGTFIQRRLLDDGRFEIDYRPLSDQRPPAGRNYSLPRHAGTAYSLAHLYGKTGDDSVLRSAESATGWIVGRLLPCGADGLYCFSSGRNAWLGASALAAVALLEYQRQTGDTGWADYATGLLDFILTQQKADGDFHHLYDLRRTHVNETVRLSFFSGEAAYALSMGFKQLGDPVYRDAAKRALDYLTKRKYQSFFLGRFMYGADHWTCIAAEEAWPELNDPAYLDFCLGYMAFMGRVQFREGHSPAGFAGHYGFSHFAVPQAANTAAMTEAAVATYRLAQHHGQEAPGLYDQIEASLDALARDQIREESGFMMANLQEALGGVRTSLVEPVVRIDNVQHAVVAWLRGSELVH